MGPLKITQINEFTPAAWAKAKAKPVAEAARFIFPFPGYRAEAGEFVSGYCPHLGL